MSRALFAVAAIFLATPAHADYFDAIEDLPVAPGLEEAAPGFSFDGAAGRIIGASASGETPPAIIRTFYAQTLPALGWSQSPGVSEDGDLIFLRGRERLALTIAPRANGSAVRVRLFMRPSSLAD